MYKVVIGRKGSRLHVFKQTINEHCDSQDNVAPKRFPHPNLQNLGIYLTGQKETLQIWSNKDLMKEISFWIISWAPCHHKGLYKSEAGRSEILKEMSQWSGGWSYGPMSQRMQVDSRSSRKLSALCICAKSLYLLFYFTYQHHSEESFLLSILKMVKLRLGVLMASELHHGHTK